MSIFARPRAPIIGSSVLGKTRAIINDKLAEAVAGSNKSRAEDELRERRRRQRRERGVQRTRAKEMERQATKVSPGATEEARRDPYRRIGDDSATMDTDPVSRTVDYSAAVMQDMPHECGCILCF